MNIYTDSNDVSSNVPYFVKRLLDNSVDRTSRGFQNIYEGKVCSVLTGTADVMLARVESLYACALTPLGVLGIVKELVYSSLQFICYMPLNVFTRIPGVSSFGSLERIKSNSSDSLYRIARVYLKIISVMTLFMTVSAINVVIPGVIRAQGTALNLIHYSVESLGSLQYVRAIAANGDTVVGTMKRLDCIDRLEEFCRAFSSKNYMQDLKVPALKHFHAEAFHIYIAI